MKVVKRDGKVVNFDDRKIDEAIKKAFSSIGRKYVQDDIEEITLKVVENIPKNQATVEEIQDLVEDSILRLGYDDVFQEYSIYRRKRAISRERLGINNTKLLKDIESITKSSIENDSKRENANVDGDTPMGTMLQYGSTLSKQFATSYLLSNKSREAHERGDIHIHDLDFYPMGTTTCLQIDLDKLFTGGFSTGHGHLREPQSIGSYAALAAIAIQANQNDQHEI